VGNGTICITTLLVSAISCLAAFFLFLPLYFKATASFGKEVRVVLVLLLAIQLS
jgi:hypothetical protein